MKNKIAIEYLKDMLASAEANLHVPDMAEHAEALDMAIEALSNSQKHSDSLIRTSADSVSEADVIYRADAIDAVVGLVSSMSVCISIDECHGMKRMQGMVVRALDDLPSAQRTGEWIDRSEGGRILNPWWESHKCDQCGYFGSGSWNYCPYCGSHNGSEL